MGLYPPRKRSIPFKTLTQNSYVCIYVPLYMPRKSTVEKIIEDDQPVHVLSPSSDFFSYLVLYSFYKNPSHRFYKSLEEMTEYISMGRIHRGIIEAFDLRGVQLVKRLILHYGGQSRVFKAQEIELAEE